MSQNTRGVQIGVPLAQALDDHPMLATLMQRLQASRDVLTSIMDLVPEGLRNQVQAGPIDGSGWTLLVSHASAAAKLRQMLPQFEARLAERALPGSPIRIKVLNPR